MRFLPDEGRDGKMRLSRGRRITLSGTDTNRGVADVFRNWLCDVFPISDPWRLRGVRVDGGMKMAVCFDCRKYQISTATSVRNAKIGAERRKVKEE